MSRSLLQDRQGPTLQLAGQVLRGPPSAFWKRSGSAAETVLGLEKLLRKLVCHCTFVYVRCDHCVLSFEACRARMEPAVAAPDTEGCFEVKRVKTSILLDPQYLGDISIGVSCGSCQSSLPHAHRLHA